MLLVRAAAFDMLFHQAPTAWHTAAAMHQYRPACRGKACVEPRHAKRIRSIHISMHAAACVHDGSSATCRLAYGHDQPACDQLVTSGLLGGQLVR
jgi:hypothetical protein